MRADYNVYTLITHEFARFPDVKNGYLDTLHGIKEKNRLKRFQIENDSQKGVPFLADRVTNPVFPSFTNGPRPSYALNQLKTKYRTFLDCGSGIARMNCFRTVVANLPALTTSKGPITDSGVSTETMNGA